VNDERPDGLVFEPELLTEDEERALLVELEGLECGEVRMRGQTARRRVRHFGLRYDYESPGNLVDADPLPAWLEEPRARCAALAGVGPEELVETLVSRYPPGAPIGWHRDAPMFGRVAGISLGSAARMRFQRGKGGERRVLELPLPPRSAYVLRGAARWAWQHSIPPMKELGYSITFRTLRKPQ